jgi:hypothetical protein
MRPYILSLLAITAGGIATVAPAAGGIIPTSNVVNIDFNGYISTESLGQTYTGSDGLTAGSTAVWNGLVANSTGTNGVLLTVSGYNLKDAAGLTTAIGLSVTPVGGDNQDANHSSGDLSSLTGDYIFYNAGGDSSNLNPTVTISGLTTSNIDVYLRIGTSGDVSKITFGGVDCGETGAKGPSILYFKNIPVANDGTVLGHLATDNTTLSTITGLNIVIVPEPASFGLLALGGLLALRRRRG